MRTVKAHESLHISADSPEPSLFDNAINTKISYAACSLNAPTHFMHGLLSSITKKILFLKFISEGISKPS